MLRTALVTAFGLALLATPAFVLAGAPAPASKDPKAAPAGTYNLDGRHASAIARVPHGNGVSLSTFRFDEMKGTLNWNPDNISASSVNVTVVPSSITSNVKGFAADLAGERFLNAAKFPESTFVSTGIRTTGPTSGEISGNLTFMGVTKPVTISAQLYGAGRSGAGKGAVGFTGTMKFKRSDFGFNAMVGPIGDEVEVLLDVEFLQQ